MQLDDNSSVLPAPLPFAKDAPSDKTFEDLLGPKPAPLSPIDRFVQDEEKNKKQQLIQTQQLNLDPARQAKALDVSKQYGVPPHIAYETPQDFPDKKKQLDFDALLKDAPATATLMSDPQKGPVTKGDANQLATIERSLILMGGPMGMATAAAMYRANPNPKPLRDILFGDAGVLTPDEVKAETTQRFDAAKQAVNTEAEQQAAMTEKLKQEQEKALRVGNPNPYDGATFAGTDVKMTTPGERNVQEFQDNAAALKAKAEGPGPTLAPWRDASERLIQNFANGVVDVPLTGAILWDMGKWVNDGSPLDREVKHNDIRTALEQVHADVIDAMPGDKTRGDELLSNMGASTGFMASMLLGGAAAKIARVPKVLGGATLGEAIVGGSSGAVQGIQDAQQFHANVAAQYLSFVANFIGGTTNAIPMSRAIDRAFGSLETLSHGRVSEIIASGLANSIEEVIQGVGEQSISNISALSYDPNRSLTDGLGQQAYLGGLMGFVFGGSVKALSGVVERAHGNKQHLDTLANAINNSNTMNIAPDMVAEHIRNIAQSQNAPSHISAAHDAFVTLFQAEGLSAADVQKNFPDVAKALNEAAQTGAEVTIPTEQIIKLAKLKGFTEFSQDVRVNHKDMTAREATTFSSDLKTQFEALTNSESGAPDTTIRDTVRDQLIAAGQSSDVATTQASLFSAIINTQAQRAGIDPHVMFNRYGFQVENPDLQKVVQAPIETKGSAGHVPAKSAPKIDKKIVAPKPSIEAALVDTVSQVAASIEAAPFNDIKPIDGSPLPLSLRLFKPHQLITDAIRFQYKDGGDAAGVTDRLKGVKKWDARAAGSILVWEDLKGNFFVVDGHQRHGLATRLAAEGQDVNIVGDVMREADGITAEDARIIAADLNMKQGSGTALDAAKILKARPELIGNLPRNSALIRDAEGLSKLSNEAFALVVNEVVPQGYAAIVGRLAQDPEVHAEILGILARTEPATAIEAESIVRDALAAPQVQATMEDLFGITEAVQILYKERAQVLAGAVAAIRKDRSAFNTLVKEAVRLADAGNKLATKTNIERAKTDAEILATLQATARRKGPVADALAEAAEQLHKGATRAVAIRSFIDNIRQEAGSITKRRNEAGNSLELNQSAIGQENFNVDSLDDLTDLIKRNGPIDEIANHPFVQGAVRRMAAVVETTTQDGYMSDKWKAERIYNFPSGNVKGYDNAIEALVTQAKEFSSKGSVLNDKHATILIGPPAAGKSKLAERYAASRRAAIVDPDEAKTVLPEYNKGVGGNAVHEESSQMAFDVLMNLVDKGANLVLPKVGHNAAGTEKLIKQLQANGYTVDLVNMNVSYENAFRRMVARFINTGRLINPEYVKKVGVSPTETYKLLREKGVADGYAEIDNNGKAGEPAKILDDTGAAEGIQGLRSRDGQDLGSGLGQTGQTLNQDVFDVELGPDGKLQTVVPGAAKSSDAKMAQRAADAPLRAKRNQVQMDVGLFGEKDTQTTLFQSGTTDQSFFSALGRAVESMKQEKAPASQWMGMIKNAQGVKAEEVKWLGLEDWLNAQQGSITKQQITDFIHENQVQVKDVVKGAASDELTQKAKSAGKEFHDYSEPLAKKYDLNPLQNLAMYKSLKNMSEDEVKKYTDLQSAWLDAEEKASSDNTKFSSYQVHGGENYRELLLTLPLKNNARKLNDFVEALSKKYGENSWSVKLNSDERSKFEALKADRSDQEVANIFNSTHFHEPNILAHVRFNDRMVDGKKTLFLEEVQSDWHQKGRKQGYADPARRQAAQEASDKAQVEINKLREPVGEMLKRNDYFGFDSLGEARKAIANENPEQWEMPTADLELAKQYHEAFKAKRDGYAEIESINQGVPNAPFKTSWHELALKRMIRYAAENGYDRIAWTPGDVQAERYDLSRHVSQIHYTKSADGKTVSMEAYKDGNSLFNKSNMPMSEVADTFGKDIAEKVEKGDGNTDHNSGYNVLEGLDLKVGGEGMKGFYDKMLVDTANKLGKKFGAKVGQTSLDASRRDAMGRLSGDKKTAEVHSMPITPEMRDSVMQGQPLFQGNRGQITFDPFKRDSFKITMSGKADLSTFMHESGHFFLEMMHDLVERGEASPQQTSDLKAVRDWLGLEAGAPIPTAAHEQFARGFEAYLMEGKSPSADLASTFSKFKAWLVFIYHKLSSLNVNLNDDIRNVMDRLVASDAAISEARAQIGFIPKPMSQEDTGLTDKEYQAYVGEWTKAHDAQQQDIDAKMMLEAARATKVAWRDERAKLVETLTAEASAMPGADAAKQIAAMDEKVQADTVPAAFRSSMTGLTTETGVSFDMAAEMLGYESGEEMAKSITEAKAAKRSVNSRAQAAMKAKHGDMNPASIAEAAARAVHNKPTETVMLTEFRALSAKAGIKTHKGIADFLRRSAEAKVAQLSQREIDPVRWRRAELKAATQVGEFVAKGKTLEASLAKRRQMMAAAMHRASTDGIDRIEAIRKYLSNFTNDKRRAQLGKAGEMYLDGVDQILENIEFKDVSLKLLNKRQTIAEVIKHAEENDEPLSIPDYLLVKATNYSKMTLEQLEGVHDAIKNLWTLASLKNELRFRQEKYAMDATLTKMQANAEKSLGTRKARDMLNPSAITKAINTMRWTRAKLVKMEFMFGWLDGMPDGGLMHRLIYQLISDARKAEFHMLKELNAMVLDKLRAMPKDQKTRWNTKRQFMGQSVKGANVIAAALNLGNESNKEKLLAGYKWDEGQLMAEINSFMTKADWDMVQHIWDSIETLWPHIEGVAQRSTGLKPPKIEKTSLETPHGTYSGGYYPVVYDPEADHAVFKRAQAVGVGLFTNNFMRPTVGSGFTKERVKYSAPILLSLDVISNHLAEVVHYVTHYEALTQADKITRQKKFETTVTDAMGKEFYREIRPWLQDIANNVNQRRRPELGEPFIRYLRNGVSIGALGYNVSTAMKQLLGVATALDAISPQYWASGIMKTWASPKLADNWKFALNESAELRPLIRDFDRDIKAVNDAFDKKITGGIKDAVIRHAFSMIGYFQLAVNVATWHGAYEQGLSNDLTHKGAVDHADSVVRVTQSSGSIKDLADVQRSGEATKMLTMFYSFFSVLYNRFEDIHLQTKGIKDVPRAVYRVSILTILPSILTILSADAYQALFGGDDKKKQDAQPFLVRLATESANYAFGSMPILRNFVHIGGKAQLSPVMSAYDKITNGMSAAQNIASGKPVTRKETRTLIDVAGILTRTPGSSLYKLVDDMMGKSVADSLGLR